MSYNPWRKKKWIQMIFIAYGNTGEPAMQSPIIIQMHTAIGLIRNLRKSISLVG